MKKYIEPEMEIIIIKEKLTTGSDGNIIINPWGGYDSTEETKMIGGY